MIVTLIIVCNPGKKIHIVSNCVWFCRSTFYEIRTVFRFAVVEYRLILPLSFRATSMVLWTSYDYLSDSEATLNNICKWFKWTHNELWHDNPNIFRVTGPLCWEFTGHRWIPLTTASDAELFMFSLICAWINASVNNRESGDLRRHRAHDVIVMDTTPNKSVPVRIRSFCRFEQRVRTQKKMTTHETATKPYTHVNDPESSVMECYKSQYAYGFLFQGEIYAYIYIILENWVSSQHNKSLFMYGISTMKIRRSPDRLIFIMGTYILVRRCMYWENPMLYHP